MENFEMHHKKGILSNFVWNVNPLILAIITDIIKVIPYFDIFITVYLQYVLWTRLESTPLMWLNISYDLTFDMIYPPFGDVIPTNTILTAFALLYYKNKDINI